PPRALLGHDRTDARSLKEPRAGGLVACGPARRRQAVTNLEALGHRAHASAANPSISIMAPSAASNRSRAPTSVMAGKCLPKYSRVTPPRGGGGFFFSAAARGEDVGRR